MSYRGCVQITPHIKQLPSFTMLPLSNLLRVQHAGFIRAGSPLHRLLCYSRCVEISHNIVKTHNLTLLSVSTQQHPLHHPMQLFSASSQLRGQLSCSRYLQILHEPVDCNIPIVVVSYLHLRLQTVHRQDFNPRESNFRTPLLLDTCIEIL